ncbi:hypothetical protein [Portibacter lacus]|nr:hypothetical protein [Portibacter lacus]
MKYDFSDTINKVNNNLDVEIDTQSLAEILRFEEDMAWYFEEIHNLT